MPRLMNQNLYPHFTFNYQLDNELNYNIYRLPVYNLTANLFGSIFSALGEHYFVLIDNYLVFGSSVQSLAFPYP